MLTVEQYRNDRPHKNFFRDVSFDESLEYQAELF